MTGLFDKLNTLIKARLNDVIDFELSSPHMSGKTEKDAARLRERINEAIDHEDALQAQIDQLTAEVTRLDAEADAAVQQGRDDTARRLIEQMRRTQQRLTMVEADLGQHRIVAEELIQQVNRMEAAIADTRRAEATTDNRSASADDETRGTRAGLDAFGDVFDQAQEKIATMRDRLNNEIQQPAAPGEEAQAEADQSVVEDDIARRRQRLSGPPKKS
jgi:phage shock protein A